MAADGGNPPAGDLDVELSGSHLVFFKFSLTVINKYYCTRLATDEDVMILRIELEDDDDLGMSQHDDNPGFTRGFQV